MAGDEDAKAVIERLGLAPHPEGGWYRETWRAPAMTEGGRGAGTAILFLLEAGQGSHWHRVDATELWIFQAGAALVLKTAASDAGPVESVRLGADVLAATRRRRWWRPGTGRRRRPGRTAGRWWPAWWFPPSSSPGSRWRRRDGRRGRWPSCAMKCC